MIHLTHPGYSGLEREMRDYLSGDPATWGVFFYDPESGGSAGVAPDLPLPQASTVKVPIVLYLNRLIAQGKERWADRVEYNPETDYRTGAGAIQFSAKQGDSYSLRVLANLAITLSDNVAKAMLVRYLGAANIEGFMASLGASSPNTAGEDRTTARDMVAYLRNVLRLERDCPDFGRRMLDDLSNTIWNRGLPAMLPEDIVIAHKEGDITGVSNDVGIVFSACPYILAVLSESQPDVQSGFRKLAGLSRLVYDYQAWACGR